ncbi:hypothetical protein [Lutimonas sp.]|uniref:hypothetical protein n=1 Tax=Lutimonas sp. TaxID=1872403 RepID=UPI003D9B5703
MLKIIDVKNRLFVLICNAMVVFMAVVTACDSDKKQATEIIPEKAASPYIEIITQRMEFQMPDSISSGWHTFKYENQSNETHFFLLDKYPPGKTIHDTEKDVGPVFQKGMDLINKGMQKEGFEAFNMLPEWFFKIVFVGGSGLLSPNNTSLTTLNMEPGYYVVECYVKMPNGKFHSTMGMAKALVVTEEVSDNTAPKVDNKIRISSENGITFKDTLSKGKQIFEVYFDDQISHENFVGHDINLVRLGESADISELEHWLNWADPKGLVTPAPNGFTFLGGVNEMPTGSVGYFEVALTPGEYFLISEVPGALSKKLYKPFVVLP